MKKGKKTVSQSASIIQAHIKKLMCMYCIKLCRELQREEKKKKTLLLSLKKSVYANGGEWTNMQKQATQSEHSLNYLHVYKGIC